MKYYTIFLGDKIYEDVIDDVNTCEIWGIGGMVWTTKKKALACIKNLKDPVYGIESEGKKLKVRELLTNNK